MIKLPSEKEAARPTLLWEIRDLPTISVFSRTQPSWAGLAGRTKWAAYADARSGKIPVIRLGRRYLVPVPALRKLLGDLEGSAA